MESAERLNTYFMAENPAGTEWVHAEDPERALCEAYGDAVAHNGGEESFALWYANWLRDNVDTAQHCQWVADCLEMADERGISTKSFLSSIARPVLFQKPYGTVRKDLAEAMEAGNIERLYNHGCTAIADYVCRGAKSAKDPVYQHVRPLVATEQNAQSLEWLDHMMGLPARMKRHHKRYPKAYVYAELLDVLTGRYGCDSTEAKELIVNYHDDYKKTHKEYTKDPTLFDDQFSERQRHRDQQIIESTTLRQFIAGIGRGMALRECLFGLEGVKSAIGRFNLPTICDIDLGATQRMIALSTGDANEIAQLKRASSDKRLALVLVALPSADHNSALSTMLSYEFESLQGDYCVYAGFDRTKNPDAIAQQFSNDYGASVQRLVIGAHGNGARGTIMVDGALKYLLCGAEDDYIRFFGDKDPTGSSSVERYLGGIVSKLLAPEGEIVFFSCSSAAKPLGAEHNKRKSNIQVAASTLGRNAIGMERPGRFVPDGRGRLVTWHNDPVLKVRKLVTGPYLASAHTGEMRQIDFIPPLSQGGCRR